MGFLMPPHPLTIFEIQKYYENKPRFNGVLSRNNLPKKIKDGAYVINLDEHAVHMALLYFVKKRKLFISIALALSKYLKKLNNLLRIKI